MGGKREKTQVKSAASVWQRREAEPSSEEATPILGSCYIQSSQRINIILFQVVETWIQG